MNVKMYLKFFCLQPEPPEIKFYCPSPPPPFSKDTHSSHAGMNYWLTGETVWPVGGPADCWHCWTAGWTSPHSGSGTTMSALVVTASLSQPATSVAHNHQTVQHEARTETNCFQDKSCSNSKWKIQMQVFLEQSQQVTFLLFSLSKHWLEKTNSQKTLKKCSYQG